MSAPEPLPTLPDVTSLLAEVTSIRDQMRFASEGMARRGMSNDVVDGLARLSDAMLILAESVQRIAVVVTAVTVASRPDSLRTPP